MCLTHISNGWRALTVVKNMEQWINKLNEVYKEDSRTDNGRVVVAYCAEMNVAVIKVFGKYEVIDCAPYEGFAIIGKIREVVRKMYYGD